MYEGVKKIGGHTIRKHVAKLTKNSARPAQNPNLKAATSFESLQHAEKFITAVLRANRFKIIRWANTQRSREALAITGMQEQNRLRIQAGEPNQMACHTCSDRVSLQRIPGLPYYILTAYPELL